MSTLKEPDVRAVARDALDLLERAQAIMGQVCGKIGYLPDTKQMHRTYDKASELYDKIKELWHDLELARRSMPLPAADAPIDAVAGMEWWNGLSKIERGYWLQKAKNAGRTASAEAAYREFLKSPASRPT